VIYEIIETTAVIISILILFTIAGVTFINWFDRVVFGYSGGRDL
jgi:hypothetical protein